MGMPKILRITVFIPMNTPLQEQTEGKQEISRRKLLVEPFDESETDYYFQNTNGTYSVEKKFCKIRGGKK